jgi:PEP-CTERM motif-containing protein
MNRDPFVWIAAGLLVVFTPLMASADPIVISSIPVDFRVDALPGEGGAWRFTLFMASPIQLFNGHVITTADIGQTIVADASNEARFADFATRATNGRPNFVELTFGPAAGGIAGVGAPSEGELFNLGQGIADFRGFTLTSVNLHVNSFSTGPSSQFPGLLELGFHGSLAVLGFGAFDPAPVPEPASMALFATGALGVAWLRRRRGTVP